MKFRVYRGTFKRDELENRIQLKTLNEMHELPVYGNEPRVKVRSSAGPWQEVELRVHKLDEIDTPSFWSFLEEAVGGFFKFTEKVEINREELQPWKVLGRKWHFLRKGFPPGKRVQWEQAVLEELVEMLADACPQGQFLWNNQQIVNLMPPGARSPWAVIGTKRADAVALSLVGPKGHFAYGQLLHLADQVELIEDHNRDLIQIRLTSVEELHRGGLRGFLLEHLEAAVGAKV
jgi:excinuclease ABC subunit A